MRSAEEILGQFRSDGVPFHVTNLEALAAIRQAQVEARAEALEEAAKVADRVAGECAFDHYHGEENGELSQALASGGEIEVRRTAKLIRNLIGRDSDA